MPRDNSQTWNADEQRVVDWLMSHYGAARARFEGVTERRFLEIMVWLGKEAETTIERIDAAEQRRRGNASEAPRPRGLALRALDLEGGQRAET